jgi:hypothetical protein
MIRLNGEWKLVVIVNSTGFLILATTVTAGRGGSTATN